MAAEYHFRIIGISADENGNERRVDGDWRPPRGKGKNKYKVWTPPWNDYALFHHRRGATARVYSTPEALKLEPYGSCSMYFEQGNLWVVDCDATLHIVHDGNDNGIEDDSDSSDDNENNNESPERRSHRKEQNKTNDWSHIGFHAIEHDAHDTSPTLSYLTHDGEHTKLLYQRQDQEWAKTLFPDRYSLSGDRSLSSDLAKGGLVGDLPALLGVVALSLEPRRVQELIPGIVQGPPWVLPTHQHRKIGWYPKRGVLVEVWTDGTPDQLQILKQYEKGQLGKIFE